MVRLSLDEQESGGTCTDNFWSGNCLRLSGFGCPVRNYVDPFIILLTVPLAIFRGTVGAVNTRHTQRCLWSGWSSDVVVS